MRWARAMLFYQEYPIYSPEAVNGIFFKGARQHFNTQVEM